MLTNYRLVWIAKVITGIFVVFPWEALAELDVAPDAGSAGSEIEVTGTGFEGCAVNVFLDSPTGPLLGFFPLDSAGTFTETVTIPNNTSAGEHTISAQGLRIDIEFCTLPDGTPPMEAIFTVGNPTPRITEIDPPASQRNRAVKIFGENFGPYRLGAYEIMFTGPSGSQDVPGVTFEPQFLAGDELNVTLAGMGVLVPKEAVTGPVKLTLPPIGGGGDPLVLISNDDLAILPTEPSNPDPVPPAAAETLNHNGVYYRRLTEANFISEIADSKDVVIGDLDGDAVPDAFVPETSCTMCPDEDVVYWNTGNDVNGNPNFTVVSGVVTNDVTPKRQYGVHGADIDGDGDLDIGPSGANGDPPDRLRILVNNSAPGVFSFTDEAKIRVDDINMITSPNFRWDDVRFGDVDNDGDLDMALANRRGAGRSGLLINKGPGPNLGDFQAITDPYLPDEPLADYHHDVRLCDLNNDGLPEVVLSHDWQGGGDPLRVFYNQGGSPPTFVSVSSALSFNPSAISEHVGCQDFNNDGLLDLHVGIFDRFDDGPDLAPGGGDDPGPNEDMIYLNRSIDTDGMDGIEQDEIVLEFQVNPVTNPSPGEGFDANTYSAAYDDLDGDGDVDIVLGSMAPAGLKGPFVMLNNFIGTGDETFTDIVTPTNQQYWRTLNNMTFDHFNPTSPAIGDLNGDGLADIIFAMGDTMNGPADEANRIYLRDLPPVATIAMDVTAECTGLETMVMVDGSGSSDPEGGALEFLWSSATCTFDDDTLMTPTVLCPEGTHEVTLKVTDPIKLMGSTTAMVTIEDTTPPAVTAALVSIVGDDDDDEGRFRVEFSCSDTCDANPTITSAKLNGIPVSNGQIVELEVDDDNEVEVDEGILNIEAPSFELVATCSDVSGNLSVATAMPPFPPDDDDDKDDDD